MSKFTKFSVLVCVLFTGFLLVSLPRIASSANTTHLLLPTPVAPEPYPFSDRYPAVVYIDSMASLQSLYRLNIELEGIQPIDGNWNFDPNHFPPALATVYVNPREATQLAQLGLEAIPIPNEGVRNFKEYGPDSAYPVPWPTFEEFVTRMQGLTDTYPDLADMVSLGLSIQGRDLWCLKISDNVSLDEDEPEFKYSSTIHGDETTGIELTIRLAELLLQNYGVDGDLTHLVDEIEIWLCPISNPDGYVAGSRYNANGVDLNRNFPDRFTDPIDDPAGHEPETQLLMNFGYGHHFVMGANYHGGAQVFNYPWDAVAAPGEDIIPYYAPDNTIFHDFGLGYTMLNPMLYESTVFTDGLTVGWEWYQIYGGMQDWSYLWRGEHHVTIEVSTTKTPKYDQIDEYWENNRAAMLWWMERCLTGVRGKVLDGIDGHPIDAMITVSGMEMPNFARTDPAIGDYHRVIAPGTYTLTASANGYESLSYTVDVIDGTATIQDFILYPGADLSGSSKIASRSEAQPGEAIQYQIQVINNGASTTVALTDTLPISLTWGGDLSASLGVPVFLDGQILWEEALISGETATITYTATINTCQPAGWQISNLVSLKDDSGMVTERSTLVEIQNIPPEPPDLLAPLDNTADQPMDVSLSWEPSIDLNCDPLTYAVFFGTSNPPPLVAQGLTQTTYTPEGIRPFTTYYWSVSAYDGMVATIKETWSFTTSPLRFYLPLAVNISNQEP